MCDLFCVLYCLITTSHYAFRFFCENNNFCDQSLWKRVSTTISGARARRGHYIIINYFILRMLK